MTITTRQRFYILVLIVAISGFSQGMLLPLISIIFEQDGVNATLNGLSATGLYIGTLLVSPFMEAPLRKWGYKPIILVGGLLVIISLALFPLWKSVLFWFVLRLLIGIGDHALHFSTQTWITSTSPKDRLGKNIALYGLSFGLGFAVGPLLVPLVSIHEGLPFVVSSVLCLIAWSFVFFLKNDFPETYTTKSLSSAGRFKASFVIAWVAFLPPLSYGFLESSLHAIFPVYSLRQGIEVANVSIILAAFSIGGVVSQLPLGALSDRFGRRPMLVILLAGGATAFFIGGLFETYVIAIIISFFVAGLFVGSMFSLGIAYMTDLTPKALLPTGNLLCGIAFSVGSLTGPFAGGLFLQFTSSISFLWLVSGLLLLIMLPIAWRKPVPVSS
ncbi:MFS family permease [Chryseomicrobium aureum]|uniref:MFS transporter n=1 Tax=Chryseomicrobium aureum TaxID=1441723 RepID=UPI00195C122D|nr:MFS transporter [Chryseomicrobium aureum]MBM7707410.1 MFS family permease [Chryseomicrobium aureum]